MYEKKLHNVTFCGKKCIKQLLKIVKLQINQGKWNWWLFANYKTNQ
jgi:hypothetical protein